MLGGLLEDEFLGRQVRIFHVKFGSGGLWVGLQRIADSRPVVDAGGLGTCHELLLHSRAVGVLQHLVGFGAGASRLESCDVLEHVDSVL